MKQVLHFYVNGLPQEVLIKSHSTLLEVLRDKLNLISPKCGCNQGECGSCTVLIEKKAVKSCITLALTVEGKEVTTLEGLTDNGKLHPIQQAFYDYGAPQCGYCTPGMVMAAKAFLDDNVNPTYEQIKEALSGNLCRCTGYETYIEAIMAVASGKYSQRNEGGEQIV